MKRELSMQEAIEVCFIIFEKNCAAGALQAFQKQAFLSSVPFAEFAKNGKPLFLPPFTMVFRSMPLHIWFWNMCVPLNIF